MWECVKVYIDLAAQCSKHCQPLSLLCQDFSIKSMKVGIGCLSTLTVAHLGRGRHAHPRFTWSSPSGTFSAIDRGSVPSVRLNSVFPFSPDVLLDYHAGLGRVRCHHPYAVYPGAAALNNYLILTWIILIRFMVRFLEWEMGQCLWCTERLFLSNALNVCTEWFEFSCVCVCVCVWRRRL